MKTLVSITGVTLVVVLHLILAAPVYAKSPLEQWVARYEGPTGNSSAYDIALDSKGNIYVTGHSEGISTGFDYATIKYSTFHTLGFYEHCEGRVYAKYDHSPGSSRCHLPFRTEG